MKGGDYSSNRGKAMVPGMKNISQFFAVNNADEKEVWYAEKSIGRYSSFYAGCHILP